MPKCPECNKEINTLYSRCHAIIDREFSLNDEGALKVADCVDDIAMVHNITCCECGEDISEEIDDIEEFLKGEVNANI